MPTPGLTPQGDVAQAIRAKDWSSTPVGAEQDWPAGLVNAVNLCLSAPYPVVVFWSASNLVFYNDAFAGHVGQLDPAQVLGRSAELAIPKIWEWVSTQVRDVRRTGESFEGEDLLLAGELPMVWTVVPLLNDPGRVQGVWCAWTLDFGEISEQRDAWVDRERELLEHLAQNEVRLRNKARFKAVMEHSVDAIAITDARGHFEYISSSAPEVLGYEVDELLGHPLFDFVPASDVHHLRNEFTQLVHQPGSVATLSFSFQHQVTGACYLTIKAKNLLDTDGVAGILLNIRDVSESKILETQLRRAKDHAEELTRLKSGLLASMSHEIRTPLTSILGVASMVAEKVPEEFRESMRLIERGGTRLAETLNSVLLLAQFESHAIDMEREVVDLVDSVEEVVRSLRPLASQRQLYLSVLADEPAIYSCVDRTFFVRILTNLIGNALKFTEEGGVTVELRSHDPYVEIDVCDTGIGITPGFISKIFDEFTREDSGLAGASKSSGLGLAITRRLVRALGGSIAVRSRVDEGTTFTVTLDRSDRVSTENQVSDRTLARGKLLRQKVAKIDSSLSILLVEDNEAIRKLVRQRLEPFCHVSECQDAESALLRTETHEYDVILMDIGLPGMSGSEAVQVLRTDPRYERTLIIALTGYAMPGDRERLLEAGFSHYIEKPFSFEELVDVILLFSADSEQLEDDDRPT